jgi:hypothetical protein
MKRAASIFGAGLVFRLIFIVYLAHVKPSMLSWGINEAGGIARWIVTNHSFSSPFHDAHGPTAWLGPIYPVIVAGLFLVFGVHLSLRPSRDGLQFSVRCRHRSYRLLNR